MRHGFTGIVDTSEVLLSTTLNQVNIEFSRDSVATYFIPNFKIIFNSGKTLDILPIFVLNLASNLPILWMICHRSVIHKQCVNTSSAFPY